MKLYSQISKLIIFALILICNISVSQNFVNNGAKIVINNGAYVYVGGSFVNIASQEDAQIDMSNSTIEVKRDWINDNNIGEVFINQGNQGNVILSSNISNQIISGFTPTYFDNLTLKGNKKKLEVDNCKIHNILTIENTFLDLNKNSIHIISNSANAITEINGYIKSETSSKDGYGLMEYWRQN